MLSGFLVEADDEALCVIMGEHAWQSMKSDRRMKNLDLTWSVLHSQSSYNWQLSLTMSMMDVCVWSCS